MANNGINNVKFQDSVTTIGNGIEYNLDAHASSVCIEITGTATSSTVIFEGKGLNGGWYPIQCVNLSTMSMATQTTGKNELWLADLTGLIAFRTRISSISSGNLLVYGRVVS